MRDTQRLMIQYIYRYKHGLKLASQNTIIHVTSDEEESSKHLCVSVACVHYVNVSCSEIVQYGLGKCQSSTQRH